MLPQHHLLLMQTPADHGDKNLGAPRLNCNTWLQPLEIYPECPESMFPFVHNVSLFVFLSFPKKVLCWQAEAV